jgi:hypothetical protein
VTIYNDTIAENLSLAPARSISSSTTTLGERLIVSQLMDVIKSQDGTIAENLTLSDVLTPYYAITMVERISIDQGGHGQSPLQPDDRRAGAVREPADRRPGRSRSASSSR